MAVTNLTGTTWTLNDTITFNSSLGLSNVISFNFTSNDTSFYGFYFDFNSDGDNSLGYRTNQAYSYVEIYNSSGHIIGGKEEYKTITITGGTDATNSNLISWLEANATQQIVSTKVSIDLTTLSGWGNVANGQHSIQVVAKADGYKDSEKSTAVSFTKTPPLVTIPAGTYKFVNTPNMSSFPNTVQGITQTFNFTSNNKNFTAIKLSSNTTSDFTGVAYWPIGTGFNFIGYANGRSKWGYYDDDDNFWHDETSYQLITTTGDQQVSQEFYNWFMANIETTPTSGETWLLNETLSGTLAKTPIKFYSNNTWYSISVEPFVSGTTLLYYYESVEGEEDSYDEVYSNGTWQNKAYRTITFEKSPTGELLTWLQANGVKQESPLIIKKGTYIWNDTFVQTADVDLDNKLNFKSNNIDFFELFISFYIDGSNKTIDYVSPEELINVYSNGTWSNVAYKTIIVTTDTFVDSDFYTFFNANTTKQ